MTPRERVFALEQFGIKLGLENIRTLIEALGRPDCAYPCVHVAGTNGKGSVTAMVERGLRAAGHRTGRYTSPHLAEIEERVAIDGAPVNAGAFDEVARDVLETVDELLATRALPHLPTFFEVTTAIAFEIFRRERVTAAVIEVGLGGRFDATNVVDSVVTAITSIALDHERHLGHTLSEIAFEKAGIIKRGVPVVIGRMPSEAARVVEQAAALHDAPLVIAQPSDDGVPVQLALNGVHQQDNAAIAVQVLRLCSRFGREISSAHLVDALTQVEWPARLEWLRVPDRGDVLLDAAHNPAGAQALVDYVTATVGALPMAVAIMKDKDVDTIVRTLEPAVKRFVATEVSSPRALAARQLAERIARVLPGAHVTAQRRPVAAMLEAIGSEGRAMAAGSIFLVGPLRADLLARGAVPVRYSSEGSRFFLN